LREDVSVGGLHVRVRPHDRGHAPVEPAGERDLLARRLRVDVDEDEPGLGGRGGDELVDHLEHRGRGLQEQRAEDVDHGEAHAARGRDDHEAAAGRRARDVRRAHHAVGACEVLADLRPPERVVAQRDRVRARGEEPSGEPRRDPDPVGDILPVHDAGVDAELLPQAGQPLLEGLPPGCADDVRDEEDAQGFSRGAG